MSVEDAQKFYDKVVSDPKLRGEVKATFGKVQEIARRHGLEFTHAEYFDFVHEKTGMTKVGRSEEHDDTDTCICFVPSETPRF